MVVHSPPNNPPLFSSPKVKSINIEQVSPCLILGQVHRWPDNSCPKRPSDNGPCLQPGGRPLASEDTPPLHIGGLKR